MKHLKKQRLKTFFMFFCIFFAKKFVSSEKSCTFALANEKQTVATHKNGALVQLVRISACHAGGHEFESRTHRKKEAFELPFLCIYIIAIKMEDKKAYIMSKSRKLEFT